MGVNTRYEMPACRYHRQATVSEEGRANPDNRHGCQGRVRIHNPQQDRCRRFITIDQEDGFVSSDREARTFNRGSLIRYLNSELEYFEDKTFLAAGNPLPRRLHVGWFGGLIRGSSDERIREACRVVFARYQGFEDRTHVKHPINERHLIFAQLSCLEPNPGSVTLHSSEYLDGLAGAAHISVSTPFNSAREFHLCMTNEDHSSPLNIHICLQDPDVDVANVIQAVGQITFSGSAAHSFTPGKIYLDLAPSEEPRSELERSLILSGKMIEIFEWQKAQGANTREIIENRQRLVAAMPKAEDYGALENACLVTDEVLDRAFLASEAARWMSTRSFTMPNDSEDVIASVNVHNVADSLEAVSMLPYSRNGDHYIRITICDPRVANEEPQQIFSEIINRLKCALADISHASGEVINVGLIRILIDQATIPDENARRARERDLQRIFNDKQWVPISS